MTERSRAPKPRVPNFTAAYIEQDEEEDGGDYFAAGGDDDDDDNGYNRRGRDDEEVSGVVVLGLARRGGRGWLSVARGNSRIRCGS